MQTGFPVVHSVSRVRSVHCIGSRNSNSPKSTLRGLVVLPFKMLTVFDDVDMTKKNFTVTSKEIASVCKYITDITQNHSSDDKNSILDGLRTVIDAFNECTEFDENLKAIRAAYTYLQEGFIDSDAWEKSNGIWQDQQVDLQETYHHPDPEVAYLQEANRVKKLKKLPRDLVAYITIETESIEGCQRQDDDCFLLSGEVGHRGVVHRIDRYCQSPVYCTASPAVSGGHYAQSSWSAIRTSWLPRFRTRRIVRISTFNTRQGMEG